MSEGLDLYTQPAKADSLAYKRCSSSVGHLARASAVYQVLFKQLPLSGTHHVAV
jgi:hypothetical protein